MVKKALKLAAIALAAVAGLGFGYTLADKLMATPAMAKVSSRVRIWLTSFTAFVTGLVAAVVATKLAAKFGLKGGPSVTVTKG